MGRGIIDRNKGLELTEIGVKVEHLYIYKMSHIVPMSNQTWCRCVKAGAGGLKPVCSAALNKGCPCWITRLPCGKCFLGMLMSPDIE